MYYSVHKGRKIGIYDSWVECEKQIKGYSGAVFKKFKKKIDADYFLENGFSNKKEISKDIDNEKVENTNNINVYTDGSLIRKDNKIYAGYGFYIPKLGIKKSFNLKKNKTINRAELLAIFYAIQEFENKKDTILNIYTDSKYSILIFTTTGEKYKKCNYKDSKNNDVKNKDLVKIANDIKELYNLNFIHIKSHTGLEDEHSEGNKIADELAVKGALLCMD